MASLQNRKLRTRNKTSDFIATQNTTVPASSWLCGEADLIVDDEVNAASHVVVGTLGYTERLRYYTLD